MKFLLALILSASASIAFAEEELPEPTIILGHGAIESKGVKCEGFSYDELIRTAKKDAVIDAENSCDWNLGRPPVKRVTDWKEKTLCEGGTAVVSVIARFNCH